ncbi:hypothetical protein [Thermincola ferriacetica]
MQRLLHRYSGIQGATVVAPVQRHPRGNGCFTVIAATPVASQ